jgi:Tfp pilus assembly protein PilV
MYVKNSMRVRGGFSLVEVAVATIIVGIGVTALMISLAAGTKVNRAGQKITQAVFLAQELREWTSNLPFKDTDPGDANNPPGPDGLNPQIFVDDLDDLYSASGLTYSPPVDCTNPPAARMIELQDWSEKFTLTWRNPDNLTETVAVGTSDIIHVQVDIACQGQIILTTGWLVARKD